MTIIAVFASGAGSNAEKIIQHFKAHLSIRVGLIVCNRPGAGALTIAAQENIPVLMVEKERFFQGDAYLPLLREHRIGFIVLAGFLWKVPEVLVTAFPRRIVNIHPALLPRHGGKGMYGARVHAAVKEAGDPETGITIHYVDEHYDNGDIIFQTSCPVEPADDPESLAEKVHKLEHRYFPKIIEEVIDLQNRR